MRFTERTTAKSGTLHRWTRTDLLVVAVLFAVTCGVYAAVGGFEFVGYDDNVYVTDNPMVQRGFTAETVAWAFTTSHASNWHPLTWLAHMLDWSLFGGDAGGHHRVNVLLHALSSVLLFLVLGGMTGARWASAFVAAVFALHPMHVESVAWVAERKDVLSTVFWMLTMGAYARYAAAPRLTTYVVVAMLFALGLMAKPMLVTLPFVLLLLDLWPLRRYRPGSGGAGWLVLEKAPLFLLSAVSSVVTYWVQLRAGAMRSFETIPMWERSTNALVSYAIYAVKTVWPSGLAVPYPYPVSRPDWQVLAALLFLGGSSVAAVLVVRKRPFVTVGWLWFVGTLVPVIGLVQVGSQARADRYMYVPMIGLLILVAWGIPALVPEALRGRLLALFGVAALIVCAVLSARQVGYWRNTETLFRRALAVTSDNRVAEYNLALYLGRQGRTEEALHHYGEALRIEPQYVDAHWNLGNLLFREGRAAEAEPHFREVLRQDPGAVQPMTKLAAILARRARAGSAEAAEAVRLAERAAELSRRREPMVLWVLAIAYGASGEDRQARDVACEAWTTAGATGEEPLRREIQRRLSGSPCPPR